MLSRNLFWIGWTSLALVLSSLSPSIGFTDELETKGSISVQNVQKKDYSSLAKINIQTAVENALKKFPGKAIEAELDSEDDFLVYKVKIAATDKKITEVKVDAGNGNILGSEKENHSS